jgi:hypothetical protein
VDGAASVPCPPFEVVAHVDQERAIVDGGGGIGDVGFLDLWLVRLVQCIGTPARRAPTLARSTSGSEPSSVSGTHRARSDVPSTSLAN